MRVLKLCIMLMAFFTLGACFSDKSSEAIKPISEITIAGIDSIYDIYKNDTLVIKPVITQSNKKKTLSYTWEMDLKEYSADDSLFFIGNSLGRYNCRLIVENEDGKSFFPFTLYVNSPYEEGITILSNDPDGASMLSFMQKGSAGFAKGDCFAVNNPDIAFAAGAIDMVQNGGSLIVACQGGGVSGDVPTLYYLNEKTFFVENMVTVPDFEDFKPTKLGLISRSYSTTSFPILCENGKVYDFSTTEGVVAKPRKLKSTYEQVCYVNDGEYYDILFWDKENQGLCHIYRGYGPFYCSENYQWGLDSVDSKGVKFVSKNYFANRELIALIKIDMTNKQKAESGNRQECLTITTLPAMMNLARIDKLYSDFWGYDFVNLRPTFSATTVGSAMILGNSPLTISTPYVANKTYETLLFADGNKIRRWYYPDGLSKLLTASEFLVVGNDNCIITSFIISDDHLKTYVAFYDPTKEGLNGSVWVIDTDNGTVLEKYDNVCYKPVKMIYKTR